MGGEWIVSNSAGNILLIGKGDYADNVEYKRLNWVRHNHKAWVCKKPCIGIEPSVENSEYWQVLAMDGDNGSEMVGATDISDGKMGSVPKPTIQDKNRFLRGDGTWSDVELEGVGGDYIPNTDKGVAGGVAVLDNNLAVAKANKLATARTITLTGSVTGSGTFDGSGDLNISTKRRGCSVSMNAETATNPYYKFASLTSTEEYADYSITFKVYKGLDLSLSTTGILTAYFRTGATVGTIECCQFVWEYANSNIDTTKFNLCHKATSGTDVIVELYACLDIGWDSYHFEVLAEGDRTENGNLWTLYDAISEGQSSLPNGYTSIESSLSTIKNPISALETIKSETTITGTLTSGQTSLTLSDSAITTDSMIEIYTSIYGVNPTNVVASDGSVTLSFKTQTQDIGVKVVVK